MSTLQRDPKGPMSGPTCEVPPTEAGSAGLSGVTTSSATAKSAAYTEGPIPQGFPTEPSVAERIKQQAADVGHKAQEYGEHAKEVAQEKLVEMQAKAQQYAEQYYAQGREKATEMTQQAEELIRKEPTKALLAAAGVGFALGILLIRR